MRQLLIATLSTLALALAACSESPDGAASTTSAASTAGDPYDVSKMEMKSPPAVLSSERHTGPFASGSSINTEAALKG